MLILFFSGMVGALFMEDALEEILFSLNTF